MHIIDMKLGIRGLVIGLAIMVMPVGMEKAQAESEPGEGTTVEPAVGSWNAAIPVSWMYVELLTELGYDVKKPTTLEVTIAHLSVMEGDIDYFPNTVLPIHEEQLPNNFRDQATIFEPFCPKCGVQGYLVDRNSVEKYEIESIMDIVERKEVREAFDHDGDGKVELYGCPPGWGCHEVINTMIKENDLSDHIEHVDAGYSAVFAEVLGKYNNDEPVLYYTWAPTAWFLELQPGKETMWVNAPDKGHVNIVEGVNGAVTDPINMGFPTDDMMVSANKDFLDANPAVEELFERVRIPLTWISEADARINDEDLSASEVRALAGEWIASNRDKVDEWLEKARAAAE